MMAKKRVEIITTGGTFDKVYDPINGELGFSEESSIPTILANAGIDPECVHHVPLMSVDSLDMTDSDRLAIARTVHHLDGGEIIITHGTDTMVETAQHLASLDALTDRAIMLTGAMVPYSMGKESDASFNLAHAYATVRLAKRGVYIAMHGEIFRPDAVKKDRNIGRFVGRSLSYQELILGLKEPSEHTDHSSPDESTRL